MLARESVVVVVFKSEATFIKARILIVFSRRARTSRRRHQPFSRSVGGGGGDRMQ